MRASMHCGKCGALKVVIKNGSRRCLACARRWRREYYHTSRHNRDSTRQSHIRRRYGVSLEYLETLLLKQDFKCAICRKHWRECNPAKKARYEESYLQYLCVDHDHDRNRVRGLLCNACNTAIGLLDEDIDRLDLAKDYLRRHAGWSPLPGHQGLIFSADRRHGRRQSRTYQLGEPLQNNRRRHLSLSSAV
jgi:hypothetical protein